MVISIGQACDMLRARRTRTLLTVVQFTVSLFALAILTLLVLHSYQVSMVLQTSFTSTKVVRLATMGRAQTSDYRLSVSDLAELKSTPGIERVGVLWHGWAYIQEGKAIRLYAIDNEMENIIRLQDPVDIGYVYASPQLHTSLKKDGASDQLDVKMMGETFTMQMGGIVQPIVGWPGLTTHNLAEIEAYDDHLIIDFATLTSIAPEMELDNSVWFTLADDADCSIVEEALQKWYLPGHAGLELQLFSVEEAIKSNSPWRNPGVKVALIFAAFLLMQSTIGFTGQCLLMTELRNREWALRMALGANRRMLAAQVAAETALVVAVAAIIAVSAAMLLAPVIRASLSGSPLVFGVGRYAVLAAFVITISFTISMIAALQPIRKVTASEPSVVLKSEV